MPTKNDINNFTNEYIECMKNIDHDLIFNMDETSWKLLNECPTTLRFRGSGPARIHTPTDTKNAFSVAFIISASGNLLKPIIIAKGKTNRCIRKFTLNDDFIGTHSNNGWINNGIMKIIVDSIYDKTKGRNCVLLLDKHSSHQSDFTIQYAKSKNICLLFIPTGMTSIYQPLDVRVNGTIKSVARKLWRKSAIKDINKKIQYNDAIQHIRESIKLLSKQTIIDSFIDVQNYIMKEQSNKKSP